MQTSVEDIINARLHDLKCEAWPLVSYVSHWRAEARGFRIDAADRLTLFTRQKIDLAGIYAKALLFMPNDIDSLAPLPVPPACPVTLDELLSGE